MVRAYRNIYMDVEKIENIQEIDDLLMRQYHHRCKLEEAQQAGNEERAQYEKNKIEEEELQIQKLRKKLA